MCNIRHVVMLKAQRIFISFKYHIFPYWQLEASQDVCWQTIHRHAVGDHATVKSRIFLSELVLFFSLVWLPSSGTFQKFAFSDQQKLSFWSLSCARSMSSLPSFLLSSLLFSCFLYYIQYSPHSQGTKNLVFEFPGQVRRKVLGILLAFDWFTFS